MSHRAWTVYDRNGKEIDTVFWVRTADADEVKRSLVNHDGYPADITVRRGK
jgi:hypothetical protein